MMRSRLVPVATGVVLPVLLILLWQSQAARGGVHAYAFVPLDGVVDSFMRMAKSGELPLHLLASVRRAVTGLAVGGGAGVAAGALLGSSGRVRRTMGPLLDMARQVPLLGWLPLVALWLGNGEASKLLLIALSAFFPMALNTEEGIRTAERRFLEVGRLYRFSRWQMFEHIAWSAALPFVFTGLAQALAFTWIATIGTELMFSSGAGLGTLMQQAQAGAHMDEVLMCILCVGAIGFAMNRGLAALRGRVLRWQPVRRG